MSLRMIMSRILRRIQFLETCKNMRQLKQVHAQIVTGGLGEDSYAVSRIMAFCSDPNRGSVSHAFILFERIEQPTICIRNTMIKALLLKGEYIRLVEIYCQMLRDGLLPDNYTLPYMLKACANFQDSQTGEAVHGHVLQLGFALDIFVGNTLILMYAAWGNIKAAQKAFNAIPRRTAVSWTVLISGYSKQGEVEVARALFEESQVKDRGIWGCMISGYVQNNCFKEAFVMFRQMQLAGIEPDEGVLVSVLCACAQLGALDLGTWTHLYVKRIGLPLGVRLSTALIDMYLKCGDLDLAMKLFTNMPQRDVVSWNVMILGLAMHGDGSGALKLFAQMQNEGHMPDETTFISVLAACCHSGMIKEGLRQFKSMKGIHGIEPKSEHYSCVVDFLGRAGLFDEAKEIINTMPSSSIPSEKAIAWRALLSACWKYGEVQLAEVAAKHLFHLEVHSGAYALLSNIYGKMGKHKDAQGVKKLMKDRGVQKVPGCSSIEVGGSVHEFVASERAHLQMGEIHEVLDKMNDHLETMAYMPHHWD